MNVWLDPVIYPRTYLESRVCVGAHACESMCMFHSVSNSGHKCLITYHSSYLAELKIAIWDVHHLSLKAFFFFSFFFFFGGAVRNQLHNFHETSLCSYAIHQVWLGIKGIHVKNYKMGKLENKNWTWFFCQHFFFKMFFVFFMLSYEQQSCINFTVQYFQTSNLHHTSVGGNEIFMLVTHSC